MRFLTPFLLAGLALAALPVIIHLINRKRAVRRPIPTIEFLLRSEKRIAKKLKVKQLLLLLVRVLILLFLPLAMARPYVLSDAGSTANERLPAAVVFVLDDSFSMGHRSGAESAFELALAAIRDKLQELRPWDQVALVLAHDPPVAPVAELTEEVGELREALDAMSGPSPFGTDLPAALSLAGEIHATGDLPVRRTIVLTDNTDAAWAMSRVVPEELTPLGELELITVRSGDDLGNVAIVEAGYVESSTGGEGEYDVWAVVQSHSSTPRLGVRVDLLLDGSPMGTGLVDLQANESETQSFQVSLDGGLHRCEIRLAVDGPDIEIDNHWFLTMNLDREVRALLVNGDPRNVPYRDELFYLERALGAGGVDRSGIAAHIVAVDGLNVPFSDYDVVVLANVPRLPQAKIAELGDFVRRGGGLLISVGSRVDPDEYNEHLGELLPKRLRSLRELCSPNDPDAGLLATRLARLETTHPVFRVFDLPGGESIQAVNVYGYMLLEPSPVGTSRTLMSYGDGGPALVEREVGAGRVALLTTTLDREWTDLPIHTAYLPMVRRLVRFLARRGTSHTEQTARVGSRYALDVEAQTPERVTVIDPSAERFVLNPAESASGNVSLVLERAGHFDVALDIAGAEYRFDELLFSANVATAESVLLPVDEAVSGAYLAAVTHGADPDADPLDIPERRLSLWPPLLFAALILLYLESILAVRRRMWERISARVRGWRK